MWAPGIMTATYEKAAKASGVKLQTKVINKLPSQDPQGAVPGIILIVLLIGGYLGATFAMLRTKARLRPTTGSPPCSATRSCWAW